MLNAESAETTIDEEPLSEVHECRAEQMPPMLVRQLRSATASWQRKAIHRVWAMRAHAHEVAAAGDVPVLMDDRAVNSRRIVALDPRGSLAELVGLLFDRVVASKCGLPVCVVDLRGAFVVYLPAVQS